MYVLGLDQGGTKTAAAIADLSGHIVGLGHGPGACHSIDGMDKAESGIETAISAALNDAGLQRERLDLIYAGMTGADWPYEYKLLEEAIDGIIPSVPKVVVNDIVIAMRAGTAQPYGGIIIAGTGANVALKTPDGQIAVYGYYVADEDQGARALGRHVLQAVFDSEIGVSGPTVLTGHVLKHVNAENVDILLEQYIEGKIEPSAINALAKVLMASAEAGDGVSVEIVRSFGTRLGSYIAAGLRKYDMSEIELDVVLSGGIFKSGSKGLFDSINKAIASVSSKASLVYSPYEPILGALLAGLEELSGPLNRRVLDTVRNEGKALGLSIDLLS